MRLTPADLIGRPGDYAREPWFLGGALRFASVHAGIIERLAAETNAFVRSMGRQNDEAQIARAGKMAIDAATARNWVKAGEQAWLALDAAPGVGTSAAVIAAADMARLAVERAGLAVLERSIRSVGARGLLETGPIAALVRDLTMYLRQPSPDETLSRVGRRALDFSGTTYR